MFGTGNTLIIRYKNPMSQYFIGKYSLFLQRSV